MLVTLVASLFAVIATAHAQELCGTDHIGYGVPPNRLDVIKQLPPVDMPAGAPEVKIDIPENVCAGPGMIGQVPGSVLLKACDYGAAPVPVLWSLKQGSVSRTSYSNHGVVNIIIQCVPWGLAG